MENYKIKTYGEGTKLLVENYEIKYKELVYLPKFGAKIYESFSGEAIVIPCPSQFVVEFPSLEEAMTYLSFNEIPIEDDMNIMYKNRKILNNLENSKDHIFNTLSNQIGFEVTPSFDENYLFQLNEVIKNNLAFLQFEEKMANFIIPIGIYVGETVLLSGKYKWKYEERIHINPYLKPELFRIDGQRISIWLEVRSLLKYSDKYFNIDSLILRLAAKVI